MKAKVKDTGKVIEVHGLYPVTYTRLDCNGKIMEEYDADELEFDFNSPILLTDEILNKNFSRDTANHQWFIGSADIKCRISMVNDRYSWMEGCKKVYFIELRYNHTEIRKQINFVHELQRCFVLCEYEKEIEL